nr:CaiB/BaiF CoA-transferase family protein [Amylibacter sp.]
MDGQKGDLAGVTVVTLEHAAAAPYLSRTLADAGARVIKVEHPEGDFSRNYDDLVKGQSSYFLWLNRGKESICLNLEDQSDCEIMWRMLDDADIFIQNLAPGGIERFGFTVAELQRRNPRLITCWISGYGNFGPMKDARAYDLLIQGECGLASITGHGNAPVRVGIPIADLSTGMTGSIAVFQALYHRERSGKGRHIEMSMYGTMADLMNVPYMQYAYSGEYPQRMGLQHPTIAPYGAYACARGLVLLIAIQTDREWQNFCIEVLQKPELMEDARFAHNQSRANSREALEARIVETFLGLERDEVIKRLEKAKIAYGRVNSLSDLADHPQNRFCDVETPNGPVRLFAPSAIFDGQLDQLGAVPSQDEHGAQLRREFGPDTEKSAP